MSRARSQGALSRLTHAATALSVAVLGIVVGQVPAAQAAENLDCSGVYAVEGSGSTHSPWSVTTGTGALTSVGNVSAAKDDQLLNGLGISKDGSRAYSVQPDGGDATSVYVHNRGSGSSTRLGAGANATRLTHGAVHPLNGNFYYGGFDSGTRELLVYGFDTKTNTSLGLVARGPVPAPSGVAANGDWTFDRQGRLYTVVGKVGENKVSVLNEQLPSSGTAEITAKEITVISGTDSGINGIAFAGNGYLYLSSTTTLYQANPSSGAVVGQRALSYPGGSNSSVDLASCASPSTITAQSDLPDGRASQGDQVTVTVIGPGVEPAASPVFDTTCVSRATPGIWAALVTVHSAETPGGLPATGGPAGSLLAAGALSLLGGVGALVLARRRAMR